MRRSRIHKIDMSLGEKACSACKQVKPFHDFYFRNSSYGTRVPQSTCKRCDGERNGQARKSNPQKNNALAKQYQLKCRLMALDHYSGGDVKCACCGIRDLPFLVLDHISGGGNIHRKENKISYLPVWLRARGFPPGFQVLCHNCNFAKSIGGCIHAPVQHAVIEGSRSAADIAVSATISGNAKVWSYVVIEDDVVVGDGSVIGSHSFIGKGSTIGHKVRIQTGVFLPRGSTIGNSVFIGPRVVFTDDKYPKAGNSSYRAQPPIVKDFASIGAGAVILPGVTIGEGATVGAGAVVSQDVRPFAVVVGVPARELTHNSVEESTHGSRCKEH